MKKILTGLLLLLAVFTLVACKDDPTPDPEPTPTVDTVKPVITGADPVTIPVGSEFDPLDGVSATDDVDGKITLTLAHVTGTVDTTKAGDYTLTYKVKDKAGNEAVKVRVVTVAGLGGLVNGDFSDGLTGWTTWYDSSKEYEVEYSVENGKAVIDIQEIDEMDTQWWAIQLAYKALVLEHFESYKLVFTVEAENTRYMNYQIQGGGLTEKPFGEINLVKLPAGEAVTVEKEFFTKTDGVNSELQFAFGSFKNMAYAGFDQIPVEERNVAGKIYVSNVQIVPGPELENQAPELTAPDIYVKPGIPMLLKQGLRADDDRDILDITDIIVEDITEGAKLNAENPVEGVYEFKVSVEDSEGLKVEKTRKVFVVKGFDIPNDFTEVDPEQGVPEGWNLSNADDGDFIEAKVEDGVLEVDIKEIAEHDWRARVYVGDLALYEGKYVIRFEAKADDARYLRLAIEGAGLANAYTHILLGDDWQQYTIEYELNNDQFNKLFQLWFGSLKTGRTFEDPYDGFEAFGDADDVLTKVYFRNFEAVEVLYEHEDEDLSFVPGYWNVAELVPTPPANDTDWFAKQFAASNIFSKEYLEQFASVTLDDDYETRIIYLTFNEGTGEYKVVKRTEMNEWKGTHEINEDFFKFREEETVYQYIAFSMHKKGGGNNEASRLDLMLDDLPALFTFTPKAS